MQSFVDKTERQRCLTSFTAFWIRDNRFFSCATELGRSQCDRLLKELVGSTRLFSLGISSLCFSIGDVN